MPTRVTVEYEGTAYVSKDLLTLRDKQVDAIYELLANFAPLKLEAPGGAVLLFGQSALRKSVIAVETNKAADEMKDMGGKKDVK